MAIKPVLQALLLADQVYEDEPTGKKIIAGTYDTVYAHEFPAEFARQTYAYICLSSIHGRTPMKLEYVDLSNDEVLMEYGPIYIESQDPLARIDFTIPVPPLPCPHPGFYALELHAGHELIGRVRISAELIEEEEDNDREDFT